MAIKRDCFILFANEPLLRLEFHTLGARIPKKMRHVRNGQLVPEGVGCEHDRLAGG